MAKKKKYVDVVRFPIQTKYENVLLSAFNKSLAASMVEVVKKATKMVAQNTK